jgi:glucokinase
MGNTTVVGVDLGGTKVTVGTVVGSTVGRVHSGPISAEEAEEVVLSEVIGAIAEVFDDSVQGIGCGVPSVVDVESGVVYDVENIPSWREVPLKAALEDRFGVPAYVNNDANAYAVGEHVFGKGRGFRHMIGMTLGTGLGVGVIVDGKLYAGADCGAGELGVMPYRGLTLEAYASGQFFPRECGVAGEVAYQRARAGDAEAQMWFERYGSELGEAINIVAYAFDPEAVILGGSISVAFDLFEGGMRERLGTFAYPHVMERLVIKASELDNAAVLGAAALFYDATARPSTGPA